MILPKERQVKSWNEVTPTRLANDGAIQSEVRLYECNGIVQAWRVTHSKCIHCIEKNLSLDGIIENLTEVSDYDELAERCREVGIVPRNEQAHWDAALWIQTKATCGAHLRAARLMIHSIDEVMFDLCAGEAGKDELLEDETKRYRELGPWTFA